MDNNIFIEISNYPTNRDKNPRENQHTIFFCYLLNNDNELLHYILRHLLKRKSKIIKYFKANDYDKIYPFTTEYIKYQPVYPDMKILDKNKKITIYIENKIESLEDKYPDNDNDQNTQLKKYLLLTKQCLTNEKWVLYITKNNETIDEKIQAHPNFAGQYTWHEISDLIENYIAESKLTRSSLVFQFLNYMEANNLKSTKGYQKDYALIWDEYRKFKSITKEYLDEIVDDFKNNEYLVKMNTRTMEDDYQSAFCSFYKNNWTTRNYDGFWINLGFTLENNDANENGTFINVIAELAIRKKFYQTISNKKNQELQDGAGELVKLQFDNYWDSPVIYGRAISLSEISKNYGLTRDKQIKAIEKWMHNAFEIIENSSLLNLLKRQYIYYRKSKA